MGILTIDDRDPLVSYSPASAWNQGGVSSEYNSTTSFTRSPGATVTLTFSGTSVDVFGTITLISDGETPPQTSYSIDNGSPTTFTATLTNTIQYERRFYDSGTLSPGSHTLVITLLSTNSTYFLDYIQVIPLDNSIVPSSSSSTSSSSSSSSVTPTSSSFLSNPATSLSSSSMTTSLTTAPINSSTASPSEASRSSHMSTVIGVSLGALAFFIITFFAILFIRKRRRDKKFRKILNSQNPTNQSLWTRYTPPHSGSSITPFITARYHPIRNDGQLELVDNPTMAPERVVPFNVSPTPPRNDLGLPSSSKSKVISHSASPSQSSIRTQDSRTNFSTASGGSSSNQASSSSRPAVYTNPFDLPPPRYGD